MVPTITALPAGLRDLAAIDTELLVVPVFEDDDVLAILDEVTNAEAQRARARGEFTATPHQLFLTPLASREWKAERLALLGAGARSAYSPDRVRQLALTACMAAARRGFNRLAMLQRTEAGCSAEGRCLQAAVEGAVLSTFEPASYRGVFPKARGLSEVLLLTGSSHPMAEERERAIRTGICFGECSNLARELTNEPANRLTPATLADRAREIGAVPGLRVEVLDERRIQALGMRLLLGVAAGSRQPPRVIVLEYMPAGIPGGPVLGLVGKGVTFDAGGLHLSRGEDMENMKEDMAGGAAVICAMRAIASLNAPVRVIGVVPASENMPGPGALKPGDVLRAADGTTVEIRNTDAEGRLLLADGLWYARQRGATQLVDIATLTNACVTALGEFTTGLFGTPAPWLEAVRRCAELAGERCWPLPLFDEYCAQLRSDIADISNSGGRPAAAITAALFLRSFSGGLPWAHMDIAGTAWSYEAREGRPKGPTGVGVRTLAALALSHDRRAAAVDVERGAVFQHS